MTTTASADALQRAVETAYKAFSTFRRATPPLDVCTVCCVSEEVDRVLREEPLRRLTAAHFYEYNNSAKSEVQRSEEIGFFLPRMLELLAEGRTSITRWSCRWTDSDAAPAEIGHRNNERRSRDSPTPISITRSRVADWALPATAGTIRSASC